MINDNRRFYEEKVKPPIHDGFSTDELGRSVK